MAAGALRAGLRRGLERAGLLAPARRLRARLRARAERRRLLRRHPGLEIVDYPPERRAALRAEGFQSQLGQDHYLWTRLFETAPPGVFIDIGCNHPTRGSNSAFLESRGWTGVGIDAQPGFAAEWAATRAAPFVNAAVSAESGARDFVVFEAERGWEHELSSFADLVDPAHLASFRHRVVPVRAAPLSEIWTDPRPVDLLMIDVEGAEAEVVEGADLPRLRPRCVMIENNRVAGGDEALRARLRAFGYRFHARIGFTDDVFLLREERAP